MLRRLVGKVLEKAGERLLGGEGSPLGPDRGKGSGKAEVAPDWNHAWKGHAGAKDGAATAAPGTAPAPGPAPGNGHGRTAAQAAAAVEAACSIEFRNLGVKLAVERGTTVLDAAVDAGLDLNHYCGGMCSCGSCRVQDVDGPVSEKDEMEDATLSVVQEGERDRLSCQTRIFGPVSVTVPEQG
jgi:2Fe-2S ferredoxin